MKENKIDIRFIIVTLVTLLKLINIVECKLDEAFVWQEVDYSWPSDAAKQLAIEKGDYIIKNNLPVGLEVWNDKLFLTVPRWKSGVASSLNYIKISDNNKSPILYPYPSWEANTLPTAEHNHSTSDSIISTFRIRADECDRLWVMDTGLNDILGNPNQILPPSIIIYDLKTDKMLHRFTIPADQTREDTFFANIIVDTMSNDCGRAFAYLPDLGTYSVVVYSLEENKSWRVKHNFFHFDPLYGDYNVSGTNFQWTDGIFGMALSAPHADGHRTVYFHAFSSTKEFSVSNRVLQNETHALSSDAYYDYQLVGDRGSNGQSSAEFIDENTGVLVYTQVNKDAVACWNTAKPYNTDTQGLIDSDSDALIFPNDLKVDRNGIIWVLSDRLPIFLYGTLPEKQFNYRILKGKVKDLIQGTPCA